VPSVGGAGATNDIFPTQSISPNSYLDVDIVQLAAGDALWAAAGVSAAITIAPIDGTLIS